MSEFLQYLAARLQERFPLPGGWSYRTSVLSSGPVANTIKTVFHAEAVSSSGKSFSVGTAQWLGNNPEDAYKAIDAFVNNLWSAAIYNNIYALESPEQSPIGDSPPPGGEDAIPLPISVDVEEESGSDVLMDSEIGDSRLTKPSKPVTSSEITVGSYYLTFPIPNATQRAASVIAFNLVKGRAVPLPGFGKKVKVVDGEYRGETAKFEVEVLENPIPIAVLVYGIGILVGLAFVTLSLVKIEHIVEASPEIVGQIGGAIGNVAILFLIAFLAWLVHKFSGS